ncbi:MAG TPA: hypothetical protein VNA30_03405, partial [Mycobacteriales bacterium]|nr:hypothetical protein [Mycobacteriales bacterium]
MSTWQITPDADDATAYAVLGQDKLANGYAVADLEPPFRQHTRVGVASRDGQEPEAAILVLRHLAFTATCPVGSAEGVGELIARLELPDTTFVMAHEAHLPAVQQAY